MSLIVATATCFETFLYFIDRTAIRVPVFDMLDWLQFYDDRLRANDWLGYLWTPHNGHRILFTRALIAVDIQWLDGYGTASATFNAALWTLSILAAWQVVLTSKHSPIFNSFACCFVVHTAKFHVRALIDKLDAVGRTDAVAHAARRGVIHL